MSREYANETTEAGVISNDTAEAVGVINETGSIQQHQRHLQQNGDAQLCKATSGVEPGNRRIAER